MFGVGRTTALAALAVADGARIREHRPKDGYQMYEGKPLLEFSACKEHELADMQKALESSECHILAEDLILPSDGSCSGDMAVCRELADAKDLESQFKGHIDIVSEDAAAYFRKTSGTAKSFDARAEPANAFYSDWRNFDARMGRVEQAVAASGGIASIEVAGKSWENDDIKLVRFTGSGYSPGKPKVVFIFNLHAREWISGMAGVYAVEKLIDVVRADGSFLDNTEVVMVPMANPDGFRWTESESRFHRKNTNGAADAGWFCTGGVDLNRNFAAYWNMGGSSGNRCQDTYHGPSPGSEPETQVIQNIMEESPMAVFIDVHAYTQVLMSSWSYKSDDHPRKAEYDDLGNRMLNAVQGKHGAQYRYGAIAQILYAASGSSVDYASDLGALGYCYELRPRRNQGSAGFAPPPEEILPTSEECWEGLAEAIKYSQSQ